MTDGSCGPLTGLRVLELGHFVAAPFCTRLLADLGAEVIKVEPPSGDPVRKWGKQVNGKTPWWSVHGRNKKSITLDLKHRSAVQIVLDLAGQSDALVENFRPGHLDRLGLGEATLRQARPDLIIARISGFGQGGPYRSKAAFGVIGEAMGGLRFLTNHAPGVSDLPPVRVGVSIGDSIAGLYAAFGVVAALWGRDSGGNCRLGRTVDVALTESVLSMMEGMLPELSVLGTVRQPTGSRIATAAPSSAYPTKDGKWLLIAGNSEPLFARLAGLIGKPEMASHPSYLDNFKRVENADSLDAEISAWTSQRTGAEAESLLSQADIPCTQVYTAVECAADPQFRARGMVREIEDPQLGSVLHPGIVPHVPEDPGSIRWAGPELGAHTEDVLGGLLGMSARKIEGLRREGVI